MLISYFCGHALKMFSFWWQDTGKPSEELVDRFVEDVKENMNAHNVAAFVNAYNRWMHVL